MVLIVTLYNNGGIEKACWICQWETRRINTVLTESEEQIIVFIRKATELGLDDLVRVLKPSIPSITRSNLHRCLKRQGLSKLERLPIPRERKKLEALKTKLIYLLA